MFGGVNIDSQALGLIETIGMVVAVQAADTCLKAANVQLIGYEITRGGLVTVKIEGNVGAVKSAIYAVKASISVLDKLFATLVIPRPSLGISWAIQSKCTKAEKDTVLREKHNDINKKVELLKFNKVKNTIAFEEKEVLKKVEDIKEVDYEEIYEKETQKNQVESFSDSKSNEINIINKEDELGDVLNPGEVEENSLQKTKKSDFCNLCYDPKCLRKRGQTKSLCIHYKEKIQDSEGDIKDEIR